MKKELAMTYSTPPMPLDKLGKLEELDDGEPDDPWYTLEWNPYGVGE